MACRRYFLSNPRPISGIARKDSVTSLSIKLEARSAVHRCFRAYQIDVDTDLFGVWLVEMSYGRIGGLGRSKIRSFTTIEGAQAQVHACLRKRATAPRRIGVAYRVRTRCEQWCQPDLVDHLDAWFSRGRWRLCLAWRTAAASASSRHDELFASSVGWPIRRCWEIRLCGRSCCRC